MNNEIKIFDFHSNEVRVIQDENGEPWFVAKDICDVLNLSDTSMAVRSLDDDEKLAQTLFVSGQNRNVTLINESGLYSLVLRSNKPEAKKFKKWVTKDVLPTIRKHGGYLTVERTEELIANPDLIIQLAQTLKDERAKREEAEMIAELQRKQLDESAPKVEYFDTVLDAPDGILTNVIAKEMGYSAIKLNQILKSKGVVYKSGDTWVLYRKYQDRGYAKTKTYIYKGADGTERTSIQTVWTQKGREFIHRLLTEGK